MNHDALNTLVDQSSDIQRAIDRAVITRRSLHWDLEQNRREITKNQELLRVNKIARKAIQDDKP